MFHEQVSPIFDYPTTYSCKKIYVILRTTNNIAVNASQPLFNPSSVYSSQCMHRHCDMPAAVGLCAFSNHCKAPGSPKLMKPAMPKSARVSSCCGTSPVDTQNRETINPLSAKHFVLKHKIEKQLTP